MTDQAKLAALCATTGAKLVKSYSFAQFKQSASLEEVTSALEKVYPKLELVGMGASELSQSVKWELWPEKQLLTDMKT